MNEPTFCSPHLLPVTSHRPCFYTNHPNLYLISLDCLILFSQCITALPPQTAVLHRLREVPAYCQWPCRQSKQTPPDPSTPVSVRYWSPLSSHDVPLYFAFILWYYTLVDLLFYKWHVNSFPLPSLLQCLWVLSLLFLVQYICFCVWLCFLNPHLSSVVFFK